MRYIPFLLLVLFYSTASAVTTEDSDKCKGVEDFPEISKPIQQAAHAWEQSEKQNLTSAKDMYVDVINRLKISFPNALKENLKKKVRLLAFCSFKLLATKLLCVFKMEEKSKEVNLKNCNIFRGLYQMIGATLEDTGKVIGKHVAEHAQKLLPCVNLLSEAKNLTENRLSSDDRKLLNEMIDGVDSLKNVQKHVRNKRTARFWPDMAPSPAPAGYLGVDPEYDAIIDDAHFKDFVRDLKFIIPCILFVISLAVAAKLDGRKWLEWLGWCKKRQSDSIPVTTGNPPGNDNPGTSANA